MEVAREEIAKLLRDAPSLSVARRRLTQWTMRTKIYADLGDVLFVPVVKADLAGQLMVYGRESKLIKLREKQKSFLDLPWLDAIAEFRRRGVVSPNEFATLLNGYTQRADQQRQDVLEHVQKKVKALLEEAIRGGDTFETFATKFETARPELGIEKAKPSYLQNVFRTNVQSAYGAGRFRAITDPVVVETRPFVQYRTVGDSRVRPAHAELADKVFNTGDPLWHRVSPPNGYQCRCAIVTLSRDEAREMGVEASTAIPEKYVPDPAFDAPPTAARKAK